MKVKDERSGKFYAIKEKNIQNKEYEKGIPKDFVWEINLCKKINSEYITKVIIAHLDSQKSLYKILYKFYQEDLKTFILNRKGLLSE